MNNERIRTIKLLDQAVKENNGKLIIDNFSLEDRIKLFFYTDYDSDLYYYTTVFDAQQIYFFTPEEAYDVFLDFMFNSDINIQGKNKVLLNIIKDEDLYNLILQEDNYDLKSFYSYYLKSDDYKLKCLDSKLFKQNEEEVLVSNLSNDELKEQYLNKFRGENKSLIISSLDNDKNKLKYISLISGNKADIIKSIKDDNLKEKLLKKYYLVILIDDKMNIINSFKDKNIIIKYFNYLKTDKELASFINCCNINNKELIYEAFSRMKNPRYIMRICEENHIIDDNIDLKYSKIDKIINLPFNKSFMNYLDMALLTKYHRDLFSKLNENTIYKILKRFKSPNIFEGVIYLNDNHMFEIVNHTDYFPKYNSKYDKIFVLYSLRYHVNVDHLIRISKITDLSILRYCKNENIYNLLNMDDETFNKFYDLIKDGLSLDKISANNVVNALLQRKFKLTQSSTINLFSNIMQEIRSGDADAALGYLNAVEIAFDITPFLDKNMTRESFHDLLLLNDENAVRILNNYTNEYILQERNKYVKSFVNYELSKSFGLTYKKEFFIKDLFNKNDIPIIMNYLTIFINNNDFNDEITELVSDKDKLLEIVKFKKNPKSYSVVPDVVKKNIKVFNEFLNQLYLFNDDIYKTYLIEPHDNEVYNERYTFAFEPIDYESIIKTIGLIDFSKLSNTTFHDEDKFKKLKEFIDQSKILTYVSKLERLSSEAQINFDESVVASLITNYDEIMEKLEQEKLEGKIKAIPLTSMIDLANLYQSDSIKFKNLLGIDNYNLIARNPGPNSSATTKDHRLNVALDDLVKIRKRKTITVPSYDKDFKLSNGKNINVVVGNVSNPINLTYGERTGACMRIGGAGNDLYRFCIENPNGFHIRFTDPNTGEFVSRVSCFRNGNTLFLNQLRNSCISTYSNDDLVETIKMVGNKFIEDTRDSSVPIDNVVISDAFAMQHSNMFLTDLETECVTKGLGRIYTDICGAGILLASSSNNGILVPIKLGNKNNPKYEVQRDKIRTYNDTLATEKIKHMHALDQYLCGYTLDLINLDDVPVCEHAIVGEDWYIAYLKDGSIKKYIFESTKDKSKALEEINYILEENKVYEDDDYRKAM